MAVLPDTTSLAFDVDRLQLIFSLFCFLAILVLIKSQIDTLRSALYRQGIRPLN